MDTKFQLSDQAWAWLKETANRFFQKTPKYFKVWVWIGGFAAIVSGIPYLLDIFGVVLPEGLEAIKSKVVGIAGAVVFIWSKLTVQRDPVRLTTGGDTIVKTDAQMLPFTAQVEAQVLKENKNGK